MSGIPLVERPADSIRDLEEPGALRVGVWGWGGGEVDRSYQLTSSPTGMMVFRSSGCCTGLLVAMPKIPRHVLASNTISY